MTIKSKDSVELFGVNVNDKKNLTKKQLTHKKTL